MDLQDKHEVGFVNRVEGEHAYPEGDHNHKMNVGQPFDRPEPSLGRQPDGALNKHSDCEGNYAGLDAQLVVKLLFLIFEGDQIEAQHLEPNHEDVDGDDEVKVALRLLSLQVDKPSLECLVSHS